MVATMAEARPLHEDRGEALLLQAVQVRARWIALGARPPIPATHGGSSPPPRHRLRPQDVAALSRAAEVPTLPSFASTLGAAVAHVLALSTSSGYGIDATRRLAHATTASALATLAQSGRGAPSVRELDELLGAALARERAASVGPLEIVDEARAHGSARALVLAALAAERRPLLDELLCAWVLRHRLPSAPAELVAIVCASVRAHT